MKHFLHKVLLLCLFPAISFAQAFTENFDDITTLTASGWVMQNNSTYIGTTNWFQGNTTVFSAYNGTGTSYIGANYNNVDLYGTINNWLFTPSRTFKNGDVLTFYTRTASGEFNDRLEVRLSTSGTGTNVGTTDTSVGTFTTLLTTVNPSLNLSYPVTWTQYTVTISGLTAPTAGRIAFRYYVPDAGYYGDNSDFIGIDNVVYTPYVCPTLVIAPAGTFAQQAHKNIAFSATLSQTGGIGAATYAVTSGALPSGLSLSAAGVLSGTATVTGTFTFTVTVADSNGCTGTRQFTMDVTDCTFTPTTLDDMVSECAVAYADLVVPVRTDSCGNTITPTTDTSVFPLTEEGTTTITWTYMVSGTAVTQTQNIVIDDTVEPSPELAVLEDITAQCEVTANDVAAPVASDNCAGTITATTTTVFPVTMTTLVTWTYDDGHGNTITQTQNIIIEDTVAPSVGLVALADITAQCEVTAADVTAPEAADDCAGIVTGTTDAVFPITTQGTTVITWTYDDGHGNTSTQTQNVIIEDTTAPAVVLHDVSAMLEEGGTVTVSAALFDNGSSDNCGIASISVEPSSFNCDNLGSNEVTVTVTDVNGNIATGTAHVTVSDPENYCAVNGVAAFSSKSVVLYPNPTANDVVVEVPQGFINSITVYSLLGQKLMTKTYTEGQSQYSISLAGFEAGNYLIQVETPNGAATKQIVKIK